MGMRGTVHAKVIGVNRPEERIVGVLVPLAFGQEPFEPRPRDRG
jgi:hypothetical protein